MLPELIESIEQHHVEIKRSTEEIDDIRSAVEEMVHKTLLKMGEDEHRFENINHDLLKVGSFYAKTKIKDPDEFDFLVVLDELRPGEVTLEEICEKHPGFRHIIVLENCKFYDKWCDVINAKEKGLINIGPTRLKRVKEVGDWHRENTSKRAMVGPGLIEYASGLRGLFYLCLHKCFEQVKKETVVIVKHTGILDLSTYSNKFTFSGSEYIFDQRRVEVQLHGPATNICVRWKSNCLPDLLEISVDISPAFRSNDIKAFLEIEHFMHDKFYQAVLQHGSFLVIPTSLKCYKGGLCFNIAHTETEQHLTNGLSETHRRCYKLLKYLMNGEANNLTNSITALHHIEAFDILRGQYGTQAWQCFSSFALKLLIFQHCILCHNGSDLGVCVLELLGRIRELLLATRPDSLVFLEGVKKSNECFKAIDVKNVFDKRQTVMQNLSNDVIIKPTTKALEDLIGLLTQVGLSMKLCLLSGTIWPLGYKTYSCSSLLSIKVIYLSFTYMCKCENFNIHNHDKYNIIFIMRV